MAAGAALPLAGWAQAAADLGSRPIKIIVPNGPGGAADMLRINVNTLNSKIKKLGIQKLKP